MSDLMQAVVIGGGVGLVVFVINYIKYQKTQAKIKQHQEGQSTAKDVRPPPPDGTL